MTSKSTAKNGCATNEALGMGRSFGKRAKNTAGNGWAAGEVAAGAGPFPVFRVGRELGVNGIPFDVAADALKFGGVPHPMIEGLVLPEGLAFAAQGGIGVAGGYPFEDIGDSCEGRARFQQDVNVIGHDHEGVELVAAKLGTAQDGVFGVSSNLWVGQPKRPEGSRVQSCV